MFTFYFICLVVGVTFALLSFITSNALQAHVDGGADGHLEVGTGEIHFPLFSPMVIASFLTAFGAGGLIGTQSLGWGAFAGVALAMGSGLAVYFLVGFLVMQFFAKLQSTAVTVGRNLIGTSAQVSESIPAGGVGEITFSGKTSRVSAPARCQDGQAVARFTTVTIVQIVAGVYLVQRDSPAEKRS